MGADGRDTTVIGRAEMSPEEKIEAAEKLIAEARAEMAAKKRNWLEEAKPGMLFRSNGKVVAIPPRYPVDHAISLDPEHIGMSCYGWENAPDIEYLGHARDILTIALPPQVIEAHEPTGEELVGRLCEFSDDGKVWTKPGECDEFDPNDREMAYHSAVKLSLAGDGGRKWFEFARLAR